MDNDKGFSMHDGDDENENENVSSESAPRARNRTVMLTPEITGEVRARLAKDMSRPAPQIPQTTGGQSAGGLSGGVPTFSEPSGFSTPSGSSAPRAIRESHVEPQAPALAPKPKLQSADEYVSWVKESALIGILVSYDVNPNGTIFELRSGRLIVTSEGATANGNFLVLRDDSVSPMHAIIRISASGEVQVLDQLSEFGTKLVRFGSGEIEELSGDKGAVEHGDVIKFGNRSFHVCLIAREGN